MVLRLILTRTGMAILTLLAVSILIFGVVELLPGDIATRVLGREASPEAKQAFREQLRLDRPAYERYGIWLGETLRGNLGNSLVNKRPVAEIVGSRLRNTLVLAAYSILLYVPLSLLLAIVGAVYKERPLDHGVSLLTLIMHSLPEFAVGTALLLVFAVILPIFPVMSLIDRAKNPADVLRVMALPTITLAISLMPHAVRMLRDNLIEVLESEYVRMATLKGLPRRRVVLHHALPNALVPMLNIVAVEMAYLFGSAVVVEQVFGFPGIGGLLVSSVFMRDAPVIEAVALMVSAIYILGNLVADIGTILLNPRLRTG